MVPFWPDVCWSIIFNNITSNHQRSDRTFPTWCPSLLGQCPNQSLSSDTGLSRSWFVQSQVDHTYSILDMNYFSGKTGPPCSCYWYFKKPVVSCRIICLVKLLWIAYDISYKPYHVYIPCICWYECVDCQSMQSYG